MNILAINESFSNFSTMPNSDFFIGFLRLALIGLLILALYIGKRLIDKAKAD